MKGAVKWVGIGVAAFAVLVLTALLALPSLVDTPRVQALVAGSASQALGRPVKFEAVSLTVFPLPAVELRGLTVAEDPKFGTEPFLRLETGQMRLRIWPLLLGRVEFGQLVLKKPLITLIQAPDGSWNVASIGASSRETSAPPPPGDRRSGGGSSAGALVSKVTIDDGVVTYVARAARGAPSNYRVEDLDLTLSGTPSAIDFKGDAVVKPGDLAVKITEGAVALGPSRTLADAPVKAELALQSKALGPLVAVAMGPSPTVAGALKGVLVVAGTVAKPTASGDVELNELSITQVQPQCPEPKKRTLSFGPVKLNTVYTDDRLTGRPLTTRIGNGTITTNLTAALDRGVHVSFGDLAIKDLPLEKVMVDYLCEGYAVAGPLDLMGTVSLNPTDVVKTLSGSGKLNIGPGKIVGPQALALLGGVTRLGGAVSSLLNADVPQSLFNSPLEFESITGTYTASNGVITTRDLLYTSRSMKVAVAGTYALATGGMNLDMVVHHGRGEVRAKVTGTAASPSIRVNPASVLKNVDPEKVEKGLQDLLKRFR